VESPVISRRESHGYSVTKAEGICRACNREEKRKIAINKMIVECGEYAKINRFFNRREL